MINNSISGPAEGSYIGDVLEPYKQGIRNVLWLTVRDGRRFVLKGLPEELRTHREEIGRLRKEYSLGIRISHPNVVGIFGFEIHPEAGPVILMEYVEGNTLDEFLCEHKNLSLDMRVGIARQIADALVYMHSLGISHRDLKPDNILITWRNDAKIIDIGLGDSEDSVIFKRSLGTEEFGAPEQQTPTVSDSRADVYSFGKLLEILLPEPRYRKLREACKQQDPDNRISMQEVLDILGRKNGKPGMRPLLIVCATLAIISIVVILGYRSILPNRETQIETPAVGLLENDIIESSDIKLVEEEIGQGISDVGSEAVVADRNIKSSKDNVNVKENEFSELSANQKKSSIEEYEFGRSKYENIYDKYMEELRERFQRLGCGFDEESGMYIDSVVFERSRIAADVTNRMINELSKSGCKYEEMGWVGEKIADEIKAEIERLDGKKLD